MVMSAYRLVTHSMLCLSCALPYVSLVSDPLKRTGVLLPNPFNNSDLTDLMNNQKAVISSPVFKANVCLPKTIVFAEVIRTYLAQL